jgi:flagella basal body P-ring formation protein FlgA
MIKFFLILLIVTIPSLACEVFLPSTLVYVGQNVQQDSYLKIKDCSNDAKEIVHQTLLNLNGKVSAFQLNEMLVQRGHPGINFRPQIIQVLHLSSIIREQIHLPSGVMVKSTRALNSPEVLQLAAGDKLEASCSSCLFGTHQPINLMIKGFDGTNQSFIASADFKRMVKAFRVTQPISSFSEIQNKDLLKEEYVEAIPQTELITDFESLRFYKTNKPLRPGELLKRADLNAINLVKAGLKTEVIIENAVVRIKTEGISRNNGSLGDIVEVYHPQKNKKYQGKVVDINKVFVEL